MRKEKRGSSFNQTTSSLSGGSGFDPDNRSVGDYSRTSNNSFFPFGSAGSSDGPPVRPEYVDPVVAEKEEKAVFWSRLVVIGILSIALAATATAMFSVISRGEKDDFENQVSGQKIQKDEQFLPFLLALLPSVLQMLTLSLLCSFYISVQFINYASEISSVVESNAKNAMETVEAFSATITSFASATDSEWPFVTVQDFPSRAARVANIVNAKSISYSPIVYEDDRDGWFGYNIANQPAIYDESIKYENISQSIPDLMNQTIPFVYGWNASAFAIYQEVGPGPVVPTWQSLPLLALGVPPTNYNALSEPRVYRNFRTAIETNGPSIAFGNSIEGELTGDFRYVLDSQLIQPIFETIQNEGDAKKPKAVGIVQLALNWPALFEYLLPKDVKGIVLILSSSCSEDAYSFEINGWEVDPLGPGDLHDPAYDYMGFSSPFVKLDYVTKDIPDDICLSTLTLSLYPSTAFEESFYTNEAIYYTVGVCAIFLFTSIVFCVYDLSVRRRQYKVMARVIRQDKIVSDMFPTAIKDKLYNQQGSNKGGFNFTDEDGMECEAGLCGEDNALAELYPAVTVVFADIVGFTAWSSAREPGQVFALLESIYSAFDKLAYRHGVFKVETVGDCYVGVAGLPEYREDHALCASKFARECLSKMKDLAKRLEVTLGPDTADLSLRIGVHSGQVTAGVLRGERTRFQLFGDTVNTAARMEQTCSVGCIQLSNYTAEELKKWKRSKWIKPRRESVEVKGKGEMQTYWLETKDESTKRKSKSINSSKSAGVEMAPVIEESESFEVDGWDDDDEDDEVDFEDEGLMKEMTKTERLVEWNVEVLSQLLKQIMAARTRSSQEAYLKPIEEELKGGRNCSTTNVLGEFEEIIDMPLYRSEDLQKRREPASVQLSPEAVSQLRSFLSLVAAMYRPNPFHNFEHACHVTSSVRKLLTRIVNADDGGNHLSSNTEKQEIVDLAGHSYGIASDPLTQFAVVFSAIIHDADHPGVPNATLVKEQTSTAKLYKKSIAEQNSVDLVWALLMSDRFSELRACIYSNEEELRRFRQLVVNIVLATDIVDKELQSLRKDRWAAAFAEDRLYSDPELDMNRKATIVLEHLIQASDVSHTMQHWNIYKKWNEHFFFELYGNYKAGRSESDPSIGWYKGEIGFFDFYIIPVSMCCPFWSISLSLFCYVL